MDLVYFFTLNFHPLPLVPFAGPLRCIFFAFWTNVYLAVILKHVALEKFGLTCSRATFTLPPVQKLATFIQHTKYTIVLLPICILWKYLNPKFCWLFYYWYYHFACHRLSLKHAQLLTYFLRVKYYIFMCRSRIAIFICTQTTLLHLAVMVRVFKISSEESKETKSIVKYSRNSWQILVYR